MNKVFSFICLTISLLLFIYTLYKSEFIFEGSNRNHYFKYYFLTIILLIFSILTFYFNKKTNDYLKITIFSILISLFMFEYYLNSNQKLNSIKIKKKIYKELTGKKWDNRTQYQVYRELLKKDSNVVPYFYPSILNIKGRKIFSLAGISNSLTVFCNENGYFSMTNSDRFGFNNPDEEWVGGEMDEVEYIFVGDSFTHGYCVNRPHDIPSVIRELTNKKVLNLGYGRNGPLISYAVLKEYLPKKTKKIFFMYYGNDLYDLNNELNNEILLKYLNDENFSQNLKSIQNDIDNEKRKHVISRSEGEKFSFLKLRKTRGKLREIINQSKNKENKENYNFDKFEQILFLTKKLSLKNQSELYFVYLPAARYFMDNKNPTNDVRYFDKIKYIVEKLGINFIDIHKEVFEKQNDPKNLFPFGLMGHYTVDGYNEVAKGILNFVSKGR